MHPSQSGGPPEPAPLKARSSEPASSSSPYPSQVYAVSGCGQSRALPIQELTHIGPAGAMGQPVSQAQMSQVDCPSQMSHVDCVSQMSQVDLSSEVRHVSQVSQVSQTGLAGLARPQSYQNLLGRPLRVVHVGSVLFRAGIEFWLKALVRNACPQRLQFTRCIVTTNHYDPAVAESIGMPVEVGVGAPGVQRAAGSCDVMLISGPPEVGQWIAQSRRPLCVAIAHGEGHGTREILTGCSNLLDHTIAVSPAVARTACQGFAASVIYNGVDTAHLTRTRSRDEMRAALRFHDRDFVIGCVGRFSPEKRPQALIQAVALLPNKFKLLLVGWGPLYNDLTSLANRIAPGRVSFVQADADLGDYYQAMDAFAMVSATEGYGLAIMEAMMCRIPIIVTPVGFVPDLIINHVNGVVVDDQPQSIADAGLRLDRHPDWAAGVAQEGGRTAEQYGHARRMALAYEDLLEQLWRAKFGS